MQVQPNKYQRASSGSSDDDRSPTRVPLRSAADSAKADKRAARFGDGRAAGTAGGKHSGGARPWASAVRKDMFQLAAGDSAVEDYTYDAFIIKVSFLLGPPPPSPEPGLCLPWRIAPAQENARSSNIDPISSYTAHVNDPHGPVGVDAAVLL